jgi:hypothetical protein
VERQKLNSIETKCSKIKILKTMKKLLFAIAFMTAGSVAVLAQDSTSITPQTPPSSETQTAPSTDQTAPTSDQSADQDKDKQAISTSELPANIQASLQGQDYSGWTVASASKMEKEGKTFYGVELTKGSEKKMVKFDSDGNLVKEKENEQN